MARRDKDRATLVPGVNQLVIRCQKLPDRRTLWHPASARTIAVLAPCLPMTTPDDRFDARSCLRYRTLPSPRSCVVAPRQNPNSPERMSDNTGCSALAPRQRWHRPATDAVTPRLHSGSLRFDAPLQRPNGTLWHRAIQSITAPASGNHLTQPSSILLLPIILFLVTAAMWCQKLGICRGTVKLLRVKKKNTPELHRAYPYIK